jgi:hypothetical protein
MADTSELRAAVIEKQELILNRLTALSYEEIMQLMASLSSLINNLDKVQAEEEMQCNKILVGEMEKDTRATFSKADAILKTTDAYLSYKNILSLKQCAVRGLGLARLHAQHLLQTKVEDKDEPHSSL